MTESFSQLFDEVFAQKPLYPGALIQAQVLYSDGDHVVVNAEGLKSECRIPIDEFDEIDKGVASVISVVVEELDNFFGLPRLSHDRAKRALAWADLKEAFDSEATIEGTVTGKVKGGFTVNIINGILVAFLPGSRADIRPVRDSNFLGQQLDFKILRLDPKRNNIVLSRRDVLKSEEQANRVLLLGQLTEGQIVKGTVKNIVPYGAFIDLGGMDALLHKSHLSWKRVEDASEILTPGDEIEVIVLKIDRENARVSVGLKQLVGDPWSALAERYPVNTHITGKITNIKDYGIFVEIEPFIEGLVHVSEMDWTNRNANPYKIGQVGLEIEVMVLDIDADRRRISLGIKQCHDNPWEAFSHQHHKGECIRGKIRSTTNLGLFIGLSVNGLAVNIDGLVHHSEIVENLSGEEAIRQFKKGDEVEALILSIEPERERVALSIRQLNTAHAVEKRQPNNDETSLKDNELMNESVEDNESVA